MTVDRAHFKLPLQALSEFGHSTSSLLSWKQQSRCCLCSPSLSTVSRVCRVRFRVCSLDHPPLQFSLLDSCSFSTSLFHYQTAGCTLRESPLGGGCITGCEWGSDSLQTVVQNACQGALVASNILQVGYSSSFYVLLSGWCKGGWCHSSPDHQVWQKVRKALPWYQEADTLQRVVVMRDFSPVRTNQARELQEAPGRNCSSMTGLFSFAPETSNCVPRDEFGLFQCGFLGTAFMFTSS